MRTLVLALAAVPALAHVSHKNVPRICLRTANLSPAARQISMGAMDDALADLKRRGKRIVRDASGAARRMGDALDEGIDALLGSPGTPAPGLVPIPIPVDRPHPGYWEPPPPSGRY